MMRRPKFVQIACSVTEIAGKDPLVQVVALDSEGRAWETWQRGEALWADWTPLPMPPEQQVADDVR